MPARQLEENELIGIVDYGMGNLGSVRNMLVRIGADAELCSSPSELESADGVILPGVGAFDEGISRLREGGLIEVLQRKVASGTPTLGICLGMQMMTRFSEEGVLPGLGWFDCKVVRFRDMGLPTPHVGWNRVRFASGSSPGEELEEDSRYYFVHSYHADEVAESEVLCRTHYGYEFVSGLQKGHLLGVQFHPEKSHRYGKALLAQFAESVRRGSQETGNCA